MASAVASNLPPAAAAVPYGWLGPRVSFSRDAAQVDMEPVAVSSPVAAMAAAATPEPAISKDFIDFEFSLGGSATMLPADELFADGKLLPLRKAAPLPDPASPAPAQAEEAAMPAPAEPMIKPLRAAAVAAAAADGTDPYVFSPKAPSCSSRWRELLGLKRAAAAQSPTSAKPSPSPSAAAAARTPAARATNSAAARSLKLLLQRNTTGRGSCASASELASAPLLLRDSSDSEASLSLASSRFSLSSSSSSSGHDHDDVPRLSLDSAADPNPPRIRLVRRSSNHRHSTSGSGSTTTRAGRSPARRRPSPPPPPRCLSVDSPRMNSTGKIVFQGLERSSSSPCSFHAASKKSRSRAAVDRSYSSGVRVAPVVLNVPVCSRPVFGFFKDKTKDSAAAKDAAAATAAAAAARCRSSLGRKTQGWSGELARSTG